MIETQFQFKIQSIHTNGGGEFHSLSKDYEAFGIDHWVTFPHTNEQNGTVESQHRRVIESVVMLLQHTYIPVRYWTYARRTVIYTKNSFLAKSLNFMTPYQMLYNRSPDSYFFKVFGYLCFPYMRPFNKNIPDPHSIPCFFLGYTAQHRGYLCLDVKT